MHHIYQAPTAEEAEQRVSEFEACWDGEYLPIGQSDKRLLLGIPLADCTWPKSTGAQITSISLPGHVAGLNVPQN